MKNYSITSHRTRLKSIRSILLFWLCVPVATVFNLQFTICNLHAQTDAAKIEMNNLQIKPSNRAPLKIPGKTLLPLRVMGLPFSNIYKAPDEQSEIVEHKIPGFHEYYVYSRPSVKIARTEAEGWYEVGTDTQGNIKGWMKAQDVIEWKQGICLTFKHPMGRKPVIFFNEIKPLRDLLTAPPSDRIYAVKTFYEKMEPQSSHTDFPILGIERPDSVNIIEQFYLMPVLEYSPAEVDGIPTRMLKIAVVPSDRVASDNPKPPLMPYPPAADTLNYDPDILTHLNAELLFVMNMTENMQSYIKALLDTMRNMTSFIGNDAQVNQSIRFGLWGYRDSKEIPDIEFNVKAFTPKLVSIGEFVTVLEQVEQDQAKFKGNTKDYPKDVFSGVEAALRYHQQDKDALRMIVLIGDAPGHELGHPWNITLQTPKTLRCFASDHYDSIFALHIKDQKYREYWRLTEEQFKTLALNRGMEKTPSYWGVEATDIYGFIRTIQTIPEEIAILIKDAKQKSYTLPTRLTDNSKDEFIDIVLKTIHAAMVDWIGRKNRDRAPENLIAWVEDRDLTDISIEGFNAHILITRDQLHTLIALLKDITVEYRSETISFDKFMELIQAVSSTIIRDANQIKNVHSIVDSGWVSEFATDLPYRTESMEISKDVWSTYTPIKQTRVLNDLESKIMLYSAIEKYEEGWIRLREGAPPDQHVYLLNLNVLP